MESAHVLHIAGCEDPDNSRDLGKHKGGALTSALCGVPDEELRNSGASKVLSALREDHPALEHQTSMCSATGVAEFQNPLFPPRKSHPRGRALVVVCMSKNSASPLPGCETDGRNMVSLLRRHEFTDIRVLSDVSLGDIATHGPSTRQAILEQLDWLASCSPRKLNCFYFAGHGGTREDEPGGDEADGLDSFLAASDGPVLDDEIKAHLVDRLHKTSHLLAITDSCRNGTVLDLPVERVYLPGRNSAFSFSRLFAAIIVPVLTVGFALVLAKLAPHLEIDVGGHWADLVASGFPLLAFALKLFGAFAPEKAWCETCKCMRVMRGRFLETSPGSKASKRCSRVGGDCTACGTQLMRSVSGQYTARHRMSPIRFQEFLTESPLFVGVWLFFNAGIVLWDKWEPFWRMLFVVLLLVDVLCMGLFSLWLHKHSWLDAYATEVAKGLFLLWSLVQRAPTWSGIVWTVLSIASSVVAVVFPRRMHQFALFCQRFGSKLQCLQNKWACAAYRCCVWCSGNATKPRSDAARRSRRDCACNCRCCSSWAASSVVALVLAVSALVVEFMAVRSYWDYHDRDMKTAATGALSLFAWCWLYGLYSRGWLPALVVAVLFAFAQADSTTNFRRDIAIPLAVANTGLVSLATLVVRKRARDTQNIKQA